MGSSHARSFRRCRASRVRTDPTWTFLADAGQRAWCLGAAEPGRNPGRPPPLRSEGASARGLSVPRRPAFRRELKSGKFESGRHRAADQRPVAGARRRLPGMRRHHHLRALASGEIRSECHALDWSLVMRCDLERQRGASMEVPDLNGIDPMPMRALAAREQEIDRRRSGAPIDAAAIAKGLAKMPTLRMRLEIEQIE